MTEKYQNYWMPQDFSPNIISPLLDFFYGNSGSITTDNVNGVLEAAHFMQIQELLEYREEFRSIRTTNENVCQSWYLGKKYSLKNLKSL